MRQKNKDINWQKRNILRLLVNRAKHRAILKGLDFDITQDDISLPTHCPILKIPIIVIRGQGRRNEGPSLDRIDSTKGYLKDNVWIVSDLANKMKSNATTEQLKLFGEWTKTL